MEKRNDTYKNNYKREQLQSQFDNYNDFLLALDMKIEISEAKPSEYGRISELSQRTNRCTNGSRYTVQNLREQATRLDSSLYVLYLSDRYSDLGLVGAICVNQNTLELFCLSCRALSRNIEDKMISFIKTKFNNIKIKFNITKTNEWLYQKLINEIN